MASWPPTMGKVAATMAQATPKGILGTPDVERLFFRAAQVLRPAAPITSRELFAGRVAELRKVVDGISHPGRHVVIYGERGVGKTSLANVLAQVLATLGSQHLFYKVSCDSSDDFNSPWRKALEEVKLPSQQASVGFGADGDAARLLSQLNSTDNVIRSGDLRKLLQLLPAAVFIFDEFDRLYPDGATIFSDLIKTLSDYVSPATVILVGVATTIDDLILNHQSVGRALVQVKMPRMSDAELKEILDKASSNLGITFRKEVTAQIVKMSQGLPNYVHLVGLHAIRVAVLRGSLSVTETDLKMAYVEASEEVSHSIRTEYKRATASNNKGALFRHVLLACALAPKDDANEFRAADVTKPLRRIT